jgi:hypothetical protein
MGNSAKPNCLGVLPTAKLHGTVRGESWAGFQGERQGEREEQLERIFKLYGSSCFPEPANFYAFILGRLFPALTFTPVRAMLNL